MNKKNIIIGKSVVAESLGYLCMLASDMIIKLPSELEDSLNFFIKNNVSLKSIGELFLEIDCMLPTINFINVLKTMDEDKFIYCILGERVPIAIIKNRTLEEIKDFALRENTLFCLGNIKELKEHLINLLIKTEKVLESSKDSLYEKGHKEFTAYVKSQLIKMHPLNLAQELMGKQFYRISDYKNYIFISTYYSNNPCIRYFNDNTLIVLKNIKSNEDKFTPEELVNFTKVLSDKTRLKILRYITHKPSFGIELSEYFNVSRPTISHHLDSLKKLDLVHIERDKNTKYYSLNKITYKKFLSELNNFIMND